MSYPRYKCDTLLPTLKKKGKKLQKPDLRKTELSQNSSYPEKKTVSKLVLMHLSIFSIDKVN